MGQDKFFARTNTCMVLPCVYTGLPELDKLLKGQGQLFEKQVDFLTGMVPYFVQTRLKQCNILHR